MARFRRLSLDELTIDDEGSFRHVGLYDALKQLLRRDGYRFRAPLAGSARSWDDALLLNLTFWDPSEHGDVLTDDRLPADTVAHVAWHHAAARALPTPAGARVSTDALFFAEAVASAFDLYLVGRLAAHVPDSDFLQTQVPAMVDVALSAGVESAAFEATLAEVAREPEQAFEDLRALLFDAACTLVNCRGIEAAADALASLRARRFGEILHHYALSNWVLYARAYGDPSVDPGVRALDAALRREPARALDVLELSWLPGSPARAVLATLGALGQPVALAHRTSGRLEGALTVAGEDTVEIGPSQALSTAVARPLRLAIAEIDLASLAYLDPTTGRWQAFRASAPSA